MAGPRTLFKRAEPAKYSSRRGITASAQRVNLRDRNELAEHATRASRQQWQSVAWDHFDRIGEISFAFTVLANVMSRIRLYPAVVVDPDAPPVALTDAATIERPEEETEGGEAPVAAFKADNGISPQQALEVRDLYGKSIGKSDVPTMMSSFAYNAAVPGECYLAEIKNRWVVKSTEELKIDQSGVPKLTRTGGGTPVDLPVTTPIGRIWRQHPRFSHEAFSSMKALADDCEELLLLSRVIRHNSRARLNAGMVYIPDEVSIAGRTVTDDEEIEAEEEDSFEKEFGDALLGPVNDEANANSVIPLLMRGPAEHGDKIKYIAFERALDEFLVQRADRTLERILQGLDVPKDIVTGLANVKYSNAIQIDESLYKAHVEPLALMFCDAVTDIVLRPLLRAAGWDPAEAERIVVWYDPSEVTTRPDRAADAKALYDTDELSGSALRSAYGFSDTDKPSEDELAARVALRNIPPPEVLMILFQQALPGILGKAAAEGQAENLPDELQQALGGTELPGEQPPIEPTVPGA